MFNNPENNEFWQFWVKIIIFSNQIVNDRKIIIIIDGIDYLKYIQTKKDAITAFWMPDNLPSRIKFIITSYGKNDAMDHF